MKTYKANKKGFILYLIIGFLLLPLVVFLLDRNIFIEKPFTIIPLILPLALFLWVYVDTSYTIDKGVLKYRSAFLKGSIDISSIVEITKGKTMWVGLKPALTTKGLIIKHSKYDEIYIAPKDNEELIADILKINPNIKIIA